MTLVTMIIFVALLLIMPAQAQPLPYPKGSGQCASDYVQSGSDWAQSGSACQRMR